MNAGRTSLGFVQAAQSRLRADASAVASGVGGRRANRTDASRRVPLDYWGSALTEALNLVPHVPAYLKDRERRFVWCSEGLVRLAGFRLETQLLGLRDEDVAPADLASQYRIYEDQVLESGRRVVGVVELVRKVDGASAWYLSTKLPVRTVDGTIIGLAGVTRPIGKRAAAAGQTDPLMSAISLIARDMHRRLTVADMAQAVPMSTSHFTRRFKMQFDVTPHQYLRRMRLAAACDLLCSTDMPLAAVAAATGYADQSHFSNDFARHQKLTPSAYRRRFRTSEVSTR
jgi:AraC-like DNA-binding protein